MSYLVVSKDERGREIINIRKQLLSTDLSKDKRIYSYLGKGEFKELHWCIVFLEYPAKHTRRI